MGEWIEWGGGECPVADGTVVEIAFRDGSRWHTDKASDYYWGSDSLGEDIIRYRVVEYKAERDPDTSVKTLRDEFAMAALGGLLGGSWDHLNLDDNALCSLWAEGAYIIADAMLAARKEGK